MEDRVSELRQESKNNLSRRGEKLKILKVKKNPARAIILHYESQHKNNRIPRKRRKERGHRK